jgi:hypothetical protein
MKFKNYRHEFAAVVKLRTEPMKSARIAAVSCVMLFMHAFSPRILHG